MATFVFGIPVALLFVALGVRVFAQARRGGTLAEAMVGVFFVAVGLGVLPALSAPRVDLFGPAQSQWMMGGGHLLVSIGFGGMLLFAWRCFGPDSTWRRIAALSGCAALAILWLLQGFVGQFAVPGGVWLKLTSLVRAATLAWAFAESLRYWLLMQRRAGLGLAEPVTVNRFGLWSAWTGSMLGCNLFVIAVRAWMPDFGVATPFATQMIVVGVLVGAALFGSWALAFAFFPPGWYAARLRQGAVS